MYKQCCTEQSAVRQRQLEQGLLQVMLKRQYEEISVSDLCNEIGVPRKSFYRYFASKDGALYALIDHALMDFDSYLSVETIDGMQSALKYTEQVFSYWKQCSPLLDALERNNMEGILIQRAIDYSKHTHRIPRFLLTDDGQMQEYGIMFTVCGLLTMMLQWHHDGFPQSVEQMAAMALRLLSQPLFPSILEKNQSSV